MTNHARVARYFPVVYQGTVPVDGKETPIIEAAMLKEVAPIFERVGVWAVTPKGLECLAFTYRVEKDRLNDLDWEVHMSEKTWVDKDKVDFGRALGVARSMAELGII